MIDDGTEKRLRATAIDAADEAVRIIFEVPAEFRVAIALKLLQEFKAITRNFEYSLLGVVPPAKLMRWTLAAREAFYDRCDVWLSLGGEGRPN